MDDDVFSKNKPHRARHAGKKADKKKNKETPNLDNVDPKIRNPKAFAISGIVRAERRFRRTQDIDTKKQRVPAVDRTPVEAPPFIIAIVGPPKVGKSTLFRNLIKNFTRQTMSEIKGPVTIVSGKKRRLTIMECNNDMNSMIDVAKIADLVLLLIDASFGFEMEVFEFLNICQVHGFPQIMGVLTHLDVFKNKTHLKKTKKTLKHRFWTEVYPGSKLFYLSGYYPNTDAYPKNEIHNLSRFVSVMKFRPTQWRSEHSHVMVDRMEDLTSLESIRLNPKVDRTVSLYGYVHGTFLKPHVSVHIPGLGDYTPLAVTALPDPCPLPLKERNFKRSLNEKEKVMYAPFCGVGGIVYDQDAVYIDLGGSHSHRKKTEDNQVTEVNKSPYVDELRELTTTLDAKIESAGLKIFSESKEIKESDMTSNDKPTEASDDDDEVIDEESDFFNRNFTVIQEDDGRRRRRVIFDDESSHKNDVTDDMQEELKSLKASLSVDTGAGDSTSETSRDNEPFNKSDTDSDDSGDDHYDSNDNATTRMRMSPNILDVRNSSVSLNTIQPRAAREKAVNRVHTSSIQQCNKLPNSDLEELEVSEDGIKDEVESDDDDDSMQLQVEIKSESSDETRNENSCSESDEDESGFAVGVDSEMAKNDDESDVYQCDNDSSSDIEDSCPTQPKGENAIKESRIAKAESAFFSRFRSRSLQKMIYDSSEDYLNVTSRADFDSANTAVREDAHLSDVENIKDIFIGGDYAATAKKILDADDNDEDDFGDFEMLDEGETINVSSNNEGNPKNGIERLDLKKKLKEKFDMEYDEGKGSKSFYQEWKNAMEEQTKNNRQFFEDIDDPKLLEDLRGFAPGTYVRVEIGCVPCEFILKFEPQTRCPLIVGSLDSANQETLAVVQARVKKHRWHPKILKSRDPILMSIGWRRFQTIALYSVHDHNMRNRMIKYTPEHLHCIANFYGPMTPQGTGILGVASNGFDGFRITMTGTILDMDKSAELVKKLKLVGTPTQVFKKSVFIQGMFNSRLEVAKFVGAKLKTVSGIRGVVKRPLQAPPGSFRATFEDKILMSDIVFCRTWVKVEVSKFFLNIANHVDDKPRLMRTLGQLKREQAIHVEPNSDSLYTGIERKQRTFKPLKVPKSLQAKLPYKEKPKVVAKENTPKRISVIKEPHERKMTKFLNTLRSRVSEKEEREKLDKSKKHAERSKKLQKAEVQITRRQKELRKKVFKTLEKINKNTTSSSASRGQTRGKFGGKRRN